ncbi:DUF5651 domain-containing protein [Pelosinus baikalensis]|uniref:DUF5651 domain-containing protein n=1 Tax=Pelosinus baikalensis TaxID=2892015 RepID=A0ABS8HZJ7_9FIRM|nr:DUF5651 domain-containing protein [Pelosinus baikalensis]MCC5468576.1 DUF5651 domain-containing protein [Pelosinus baikalensis]MCC5468587.1 DUF5651 domain-containing protein [Pelosinus baikalensis]
MNQYLSRDEKENLVRLMTLRVQLEKVIELYSGLKNVDKKFLSELRHARTRLEKSADIRLGYLDEQAKENLMVSISKLRIMFMATPEAIQANKDMLQLKSTLPIDVEDFQDWYGFVIEHSCKTCTKADYKECAARRVLSKYDVVPVDPEAQEKCQYSYASDLAPETDTPGLIEKPEFANIGAELEALQLRVSEYDRLKIVINDILHPNGDGPANPSMCDIVAFIRSDWDRFAKEAQELRKQLEELQVKYDLLTESSGVQKSGAAEEDLDCEDDGLPVTLVLNHGLKTVMHLPKHMIECLITEIKRPSRFSRSICAKFVDDEFVAIDMQEVVAMRVSGLEDIEWSKPGVVQTQTTSTTEQERYRIECSCGAEYFANMYNGFPGGRTKGRCRECQSTVFADRQVDKIPDPSDGVEATLLTNRYFVIREPYQSREENAPVSSPITPKLRELNVAPDLRNIKNIGRDCKDPCRLLV